MAEGGDAQSPTTGPLAGVESGAPEKKGAALAVVHPRVPVEPRCQTLAPADPGGQQGGTYFPRGSPAVGCRADV